LWAAGSAVRCDEVQYSLKDYYTRLVQHPKAGGHQGPAGPLKVRCLRVVGNAPMPCNDGACPRGLTGQSGWVISVTAALPVGDKCGAGINGRVQGRRAPPPGQPRPQQPHATTPMHGVHRQGLHLDLARPTPLASGAAAGICWVPWA